MTTNAERRKAELLQTVEQRVAERCPPDEQEAITTFMRWFFARVAADDLTSRPAADLYGAALSHWHLARKHRHNQHRVHVYNPEPEHHGWESTHTIVQVVCPDRPFLVDSLAMALNRQGLTVHLIIHPIIPLRRNAQGTIEAISQDQGSQAEACMHFEVDRQSSPERLQTIEQDVTSVLENVDLVVTDWKPMHQRMEEARRELETRGSAGADRDESLAFLEWLSADHFTFLERKSVV